MGEGAPLGKTAPWHPVPTRLVDDLMPRLKDTELRVLLVVLRQTWGWRAGGAGGAGSHKRRDWLSHSQLCRRTGRGSEAVSGAIDGLSRAGLIVAEDAAGRPLPTPEERRRCLGRLYFRPGEMWSSGDRTVETGRAVETGKAVEMWKTGDPSRPGKPKTTT